MRWQVRDLVDELYFKGIRFLLDRFDTILLPTFETSQMTRQAGRNRCGPCCCSATSDLIHI